VISVLKLNPVIDTRCGVDRQPVGQGYVELKWQEEWLLAARANIASRPRPQERLDSDRRRSDVALLQTPIARLTQDFL